MPKYYCDYCDVYLTHDSVSVRKAHNTGRNHLTNVRDYYAGMGHDQTQDFLDNLTKAFERGGGRGGFGAPVPMRQFGAGPPPPVFPPQRPAFNPGPAPSFVPQQGPPPSFGGIPAQGPPGGFAPPPGGFPPQGGFQQGPPGGFPPQGQPPMMNGGGMSPPNPQFPPGMPNGQFAMPPQQQQQPPMAQPAMSPPGQGVGMQMNPARAAALGLAR